MQFPPVNYLAVLTCGVVMFILGGLWYSPLLFAKKWMALMGMTEADIHAASKASMPIQYLMVFVCGLITSWGLAVIMNHFQNLTAARGAMIGAFCWLVFVGTTSF